VFPTSAWRGACGMLLSLLLTLHVVVIVTSMFPTHRVLDHCNIRILGVYSLLARLQGIW
jgi:hypothetical protein